MRLAPWLVLPLIGGALYMACATGDDGSSGIPRFPKQDASAGSGGEAGSAGGAPNGGGAGTSQGGSSNGGSSNGGSGNGGTSNGGSSNGGSSNGGSSNGGSGGGTGGSCTPPVPTGTCDTVPQCGCDPGQGCYVTNFSTGATQCLPAGTVAKGQSCDYSSVSQCAAGSECVGNTCKPFCHSTADCTKSGADCISVQQSLTDGGAADIPAWSTCTDQCDPSIAGSCGAGQACFLIDDVNVQPGHSLCAKGGTSTGSCSSTVPCAAPYVCMGDSLCHKWCKANSADCGLDSCSQLQDANSNVGYIYVGTQGYGVCP
jgi:hypothetical protein